MAVWVFLDPDSARSAAPPAIGAEAAATRARLGIPELDNDRPIPQTLLTRLAETGAHVRQASRWLRAVSVWADATAIVKIRALGFVDRIRPVARLERAGPRAGRPTLVNVARAEHAAWSHEISGVPESRAAGAATRAMASQAPDSTFYGASWAAVRELGLPAAQAFGFTGSGIRVGVLDTGFEPRHESLNSRRVISARDFINNDTIVYNEPGDPAGVDQARHGTQVWSLLGGFRPGQLVGPGYDAQFILGKVNAEPFDTQADEDRWVAAIEWADSLGARIISSSVVFRFAFTDKPAIPFGALNGDSTLTTRVADEAARRGILVVTAIGNDGPAPGTLAAPADADSVLSVGAIDAAGEPATFVSGASARGPTADGRTKPDVVARGASMTAATSVSLSAYEISLAGTSYATALVAGGAAALMEAWPNLSTNALLRAIVLSANRAGRPDNARGHGIPNFAVAILFPDGLVPTNVSGIDLQGAVTTVAPTLNWRASLVHPLMRPVLYRVQLATDSLFNTIVYTDTVSESSALTTRLPLRPATRIWWRVVAQVAAGVMTTSASGVPFAVPRWVRLIAPPANQVTQVSPRPELSWAPLTAPPPIGPFVYDVEVLSNATGLPVQPAMRNVTTSSVRVPQPLVPNTAYRWRVIARSQLGAADTVESVAPFIVTSDTLPPATLLYQNFPNPFPRPERGETTTHIWFDLAEPATVELAVLDLRGRLVRRLIPAQPSCGPQSLQPGIYGRGATLATADSCILTVWDGRDGAGRQVERGVYLLRLRAGRKTEYRHILFLPE
jgi:subtilisin family serine protease